MDDRSAGVRSHRAHANQNAAGASVKIPRKEKRLTAVKTPEIIASARFHRFHAIRHGDKPAISQTTAITLEVTQSHVTPEDALFAEQPHGLEAITKTESTTAATAHAPKTIAMTLVIRRWALGAATVTLSL
jgi:hypothetical protein